MLAQQEFSSYNSVHYQASLVQVFDSCVTICILGYQSKCDALFFEFPVIQSRKEQYFIRNFQAGAFS